METTQIQGDGSASVRLGRAILFLPLHRCLPVVFSLIGTTTAVKSATMRSGSRETTHLQQRSQGRSKTSSARYTSAAALRTSPTAAASGTAPSPVAPSRPSVAASLASVAQVSVAARTEKARRANCIERLRVSPRLRRPKKRRLPARQGASLGQLFSLPLLRRQARPPPRDKACAARHALVFTPSSTPTRGPARLSRPNPARNRLGGIINKKL